MMFFDYAHPGCISIHALLAESDAVCVAVQSPASQFLSTLSLRRATSRKYPVILGRGISIHALLAESDYHSRGLNKAELIFLSTLSLRRATRTGLTCGGGEIFLSTLSLRRATLYSSSSSTPAVHFYPRSPCGERPGKSTTLTRIACISIHALLAESDTTTAGYCLQIILFLSTLSLRRATANFCLLVY